MVSAWRDWNGYWQPSDVGNAAQEEARVDEAGFERFIFRQKIAGLILSRCPFAVGLTGSMDLKAAIPTSRHRRGEGWAILTSHRQGSLGVSEERGCRSHRGKSPVYARCQIPD
ncbi:hypothetical protein chiPu_0010483 [Chiloscyllium punctatum]|uniref:Uncharacterized protein n=1 Tax=Chiloscyllium punctatum TaxID=137246 RepID=A0A401SNR0_CHIPU|nr:hypothetical protein [Chiloscyllium punctatum]